MKHDSTNCVSASVCMYIEVTITDYMNSKVHDIITDSICRIFKSMNSLPELDEKSEILKTESKKFTHGSPSK